jgi:hypothetical protein
LPSVDKYKPEYYRLDTYPAVETFLPPSFNFSCSPDGDHIRIPWTGKFPFQNPYYEKFGNFGTTRFISIRECCYSHPSKTFQVHRRVQFRLGSPCERGQFNHKFGVLGVLIKVIKSCRSQLNRDAALGVQGVSKNHPISISMIISSSNFHSKNYFFQISFSDQVSVDPKEHFRPLISK